MCWLWPFSASRKPKLPPAARKPAPIIRNCNWHRSERSSQGVVEAHALGAALDRLQQQYSRVHEKQCQELKVKINSMGKRRNFWKWERKSEKLGKSKNGKEREGVSMEGSRQILQGTECDPCSRKLQHRLDELERKRDGKEGERAVILMPGDGKVAMEYESRLLPENGQGKKDQVPQRCEQKQLGHKDRVEQATMVEVKQAKVWEIEYHRGKRANLPEAWMREPHWLSLEEDEERSPQVQLLQLQSKKDKHHKWNNEKFEEGTSQVTEMFNHIGVEQAQHTGITNYPNDHANGRKPESEVEEKDYSRGKIMEEGGTPMARSDSGVECNQFHETQHPALPPGETTESELELMADPAKVLPSFMSSIDTPDGRHSFGRWLETFITSNHPGAQRLRRYLSHPKALHNLHPLHLISALGLISLLKYYIHNYFLDIDINIEDHYQRTPLVWAVLTNQKPIVDIILKHPSVRIHAPDIDGYTPLMHAMFTGNELIVEALLQNGAVEEEGGIDFEGGEGGRKGKCTALGIARARGLDKCVRRLVQRGARRAVYMGEVLEWEGERDGKGIWAGLTGGMGLF